jgi:hypothetical protein
LNAFAITPWLFWFVLAGGMLLGIFMTLLIAKRPIYPDEYAGQSTTHRRAAAEPNRQLSPGFTSA